MSARLGPFRKCPRTQYVLPQANCVTTDNEKDLNAIFRERRRSEYSFCPIQIDMKFIGMTVQFRKGKVRSSKRHDGAEIVMLRPYLI